MFNLSLKRGSLRKYKDYSWAFANDEKTDIFSMKADFKSDFSKTQTCFQKPKSGKKNMEPSWNRIRFNLENWWTTTTIPRSFKILSRSSYWKWCVSSSTPLFSAHAWITMAVKTKQWPTRKSFICKIDDLPRVLKMILVHQLLYSTCSF